MSYRKKIKIWFRRLPILSKNHFAKKCQKLSGRGKKTLVVRYRKLGLL